MDLIISFSISVICSFLLFTYLMNWKYKPEKLIGILKTKDSKILVYTLISLLVSQGIYFYSSYKLETNIVEITINMVVFFLLTTIGAIDYKEKIIPNQLIVVGLIIGIVTILLKIFVLHIPTKDAILLAVVGALFFGVVMGIVSLLVKTALGMGDVKLLFVLGFVYGLSDAYLILLLSIILMAFFSIVLLILKKADKNTAIPMAPFIVIGFVASVMAGM